MSEDDPQSSENGTGQDGIAPQPAPQRQSLFSIPPSVKRVFNKFPLVVYTENELPLRAPLDWHTHILHVFTTLEDAKTGRPSFNPACLKWQTYLKLSGVDFQVVPSNNHASPSGALPFLLSAQPSAEPSKTPQAVPSNKLRKWLGSRSIPRKVEEPADMRYEAYASLVDHRIRQAWVYQLYLNPANSSLAHRLYVEPCSSNLLVQMTIADQLRRAAESELVKAAASNVISEVDILREAEEALNALSTLLGQDSWFFGQQNPSLLDASVFAYTHLILDSGLEWSQNGLLEHLKKHENLVQHRDRIVDMYY